jgi:3-methyladenine DNA glycosylase AlkD
MPDRVSDAMTALRAAATDHDLANLGRFGIDAPGALGVSMANLQKIARRLGRDRDLAAALWATGVYEARMLASLIDDPTQVTPAQMDAWRADFDNWAIVDTVCFKLFDQSPHALAKVGEWARLNDEFGKRAAFALLACLALHDAGGDDRPFLDGLALIERAAGDDRNFVKKAVNWALRAIGLRDSPALKAAALETARRLSVSPQASARWIGKDAARALTKAAAKTGAPTAGREASP